MHWNPDPSLYPRYLQSRLRKGKGLGVGDGYQPWLFKGDVPSRGDTIQLKGVRIPRLFTFFSSLEATYFFMLERNPRVIDTGI